MSEIASSFIFGFAEDKDKETKIHVYDEKGNKIEEVILLKKEGIIGIEKYYASKIKEKTKEYEECFSLDEFLEERYAQNDIYPDGEWIKNIMLIIRSDILDNEEEVKKIINKIKEKGKEFNLEDKSIDEAIEKMKGKPLEKVIPIAPKIPEVIKLLPEVPLLRAPEFKERDKKFLLEIAKKFEHPAQFFAIDILESNYEKIQEELKEIKLEDVKKVLLKFGISVCVAYEKSIRDIIFSSYPEESERKVLFNNLIKSRIKEKIIKLIEEAE